MANTIIEPAQEAQSHRALRTWVMGFAIAAVFSMVAGLILAGFTPGIARPWSGMAFVMAMALAIVVGASKTSSA